MVLAAGLGTRMRPLTLTTPKPLVKISGRTMLDRALDALEKTGVKTVVVNVHHLADQIVAHLEGETNRRFDIIISDESEKLLDSAGGIIKALPHLGQKPFFVLNADTFWTEDQRSNLMKLAQNFNPETMDILMLTVARDQAAAPERGDFLMKSDGRLTRAAPDIPQAVIYGGALVIRPDVFKDAMATPQSLNLYFDRAIEKNRLYGLPLVGRWYTVGTVDMIGEVEKCLSFDNNGIA